MEHSFLISSEVLYSTSVQNYIVYNIRYTHTHREFIYRIFIFSLVTITQYTDHTHQP